MQVTPLMERYPSNSMGILHVDKSDNFVSIKPGPKGDSFYVRINGAIAEFVQCFMQYLQPLDAIWI